MDTICLFWLYRIDFRYNCINIYQKQPVKLLIVPMTIWTPNLQTYTGPKYRALADAIADDIKAGVLRPEQKLPPQRQLADLLGVTVGTITRGYAEAEKRELVYARMGSGTFINGKKSDMGDFLGSLDHPGGVIDLSLSVTLSDTQTSVLGEILAEISSDRSKLESLATYQSEAGMAEHRVTISGWLGQFGVSTDPEKLILCNGGQNAINTIITALTRPDDRVLSEALTYPGFTYLAKQHHLKHIGVPMDHLGIIPGQLERICQKFQPKLLYCNPNLQNPTAITLSEERRHQILEIAERHDLLIIEDQVQGIFQDAPPPSLQSLAPERVILCGSFSKIFAGGLRVGFIAAPDRFLNGLKSALYLNCLFAPPIMAEIVCRSIRSGKMEEMLISKKREIATRQRLAREILREFDLLQQDSCPHAWLSIPDLWDADNLILKLQQRGVLVKATKSFKVGTVDADEGIRICLSNPPTRKAVHKGLEIIRKTLSEQPGVWESII